METVVVSVRLARTLVDAVDRTGRERSEVVRDAVQEWLRQRMVAQMVREDEAAYRRLPETDEEREWAEIGSRELSRFFREEEKAEKRANAAAKKTKKKRSTKRAPRGR